jgi:hypothetical protein
MITTQMDRNILNYLCDKTKGFLWERPGVVVVGGALRDLDTGREPKDVDFLVNQGVCEVVLRNLLNSGYSVVKKGREQPAEGEGYTAINEYLLNVYCATQEGLVDIDILEISCDHKEYLKMLPINSSCIAFGVDYSTELWRGGGVFRDDAYYDFLVMEQIVISDKRLRSDYLERLKGYYPTYNVVVDDDYPDDQRGISLDSFFPTRSTTDQHTHTLTLNPFGRTRVATGLSSTGASANTGMSYF